MIYESVLKITAHTNLILLPKLNFFLIAEIRNNFPYKILIFFNFTPHLVFIKRIRILLKYHYAFMCINYVFLVLFNDFHSVFTAP